MKGIVFTNFLNLVESLKGEKFVEELIDDSKLQSKGAYTNVGTYDHSEILKMVTVLSSKIKMPIAALVEVFGKHLHSVFVAKFPNFYEGKTCFSFLMSLEDHIHVEVRKLYPEAELPRFVCTQKENELKMVYSSARPFADLAQGLIKATIDHFGEPIELKVEDGELKPAHNRTFILKKAG